MQNRYGLLFLVSFAVGLSGCAATSKNTAGTPLYGTQAWNQAPAPPQRTVATTVPTASQGVDELNPASKPVGLAKYFPGLQRPKVEPPKLAHYRPTWFGLRPNPTTKPALPTTYMTDARAGLNRPIFDSAPTLPVALQVPAPKPTTDQAVTPTNVEQPITAPGSSELANPAPSSGLTIPDLGGKPSKAGDAEVNPLPPAIEPTKPAETNAVDRMPQIPPVDPQLPAKPANDEPMKPTADTSAPKNPSDDQAVKAISSPNASSLASGLPEPTVPASYASIMVAQEAVGMKKLGECKIFASPQSAPKPTVKATPQGLAHKVKPTSQSSPIPTSLSKPSPQATASGQGATTETTETTWQRPCLRRMFRKVCKLGEYADPPTAAPH